MLKYLEIDGIIAHIEAYEDGIINESASGIYIPTKFDIYDIIQESAMVVPIQESVTRAEIESYVKEKSSNLRSMSDLFGINNFTGVLNEAGTHMILKSDEITAHVPVEHVLNMQYADMLSLRKKK